MIIPESNYVEVPIFVPQSLKGDVIHEPASFREKVTSALWAGEVPGRSQRAESVRIKLEPGAGLVKQKLYPLKIKKGKEFIPPVENLIKDGLVKRIVSPNKIPVFSQRRRKMERFPCCYRTSKP